MRSSRNFKYESERIPRITNFLRIFRIDETLQLLNIIKGEMSFVGPRPLLTRYLKNYKKDQYKRHDVKPGITGLSQINGSENLDFDKRILLDIKYVKNLSLFLDLNILIRTIFYVFKNSFKSTNFKNLPEFPTKFKWYIYCAGSLSNEIIDISLRCGFSYSDILLVDDFSLQKNAIVPIINFQKMKENFKSNDSVVIANGEPIIRKQISERIKKSSLKLGKLIDPSSLISPYAKIGDGVIVCPFCSISSNTIIKENVLINTQSIVGHDVIIDANSVISSMVNLGGNVEVKESVYIGIGALIRENLEINDNAIVSMGSAVHRNVEKNVIVVGDPARPYLRNNDQRIFKKSN